MGKRWGMGVGRGGALLLALWLVLLPVATHSVWVGEEEVNHLRLHTQEIHENPSLQMESTVARVAETGLIGWEQPVGELELYAQSAILMDYETGEVLYEREADQMLAPASMTKIMTTYIIFEELEAGNLTLETPIPISRKNANLSRNPNYPAMVGLPAGGEVDVDTLLKLILLPSSSASCIVMAEYISGSEAAFVERMNETASRLGVDADYKNTHGALSHTVTARGQAILVREFIRRFPRLLEYTALEKVYFNKKTYYNTNRMARAGDYEYEGCDGLKTGTTEEAGFCFTGTAVRDDRRVIVVVMRSIGDHFRFLDTKTLFDAGFHWLAENGQGLDERAESQAG